MRILHEGELEFDFTGAVSAERIDRQDVPQAVGLKLADFLVTEKRRLLVVEVKDPGDSHASPENREKFLKKLFGSELISTNLVPKARDTYTFLRLMKRDSKPQMFVVVLGLDGVPFDRTLLGPFKDRLLQRLRQETDEPWKRQYMTDCVVLTLETWPTAFPRYQVKRRAPQL